MAERPSAGPAVTIVVGSERVQVTGRAAPIIALVATPAERVNAVLVGKLILRFAHEQVKPEMVESLPTLQLDK